MVGAAPLAVTPIQIANSQQNKKAFVGSVTYDSAVKCAAFLNELTLAQASLNTTADIISTALTAAATAVTPLNTVHALTATSTVVSGSKAAFNANYYSKASFATFQVALQNTYYRSLNDYLSALDRMDETNLDIGSEVTKIQTIHASCTLAAAESSILATMQPPPATAPNGQQPAPAPAPAPAENPPAPQAPLGAKPQLGTAPTHGAAVGARLWQ